MSGWVKCEEPGGQSDNNSTLAINPDGLTERIGPLVTSAADENIIPAFSPTLSSDIIERWQRQTKPWRDEWEIVKPAHVSTSIKKICSAHWDCDGFSHVVQDSSFCLRLLIMAHCFGCSRGPWCGRPCGDARLPIHSPAAGRNAWSAAHLHQGTEVMGDLNTLCYYIVKTMLRQCYSSHHDWSFDMAEKCLFSFLSRCWNGVDMCSSSAFQWDSFSFYTIQWIQLWSKPPQQIPW